MQAEEPLTTPLAPPRWRRWALALGLSALLGLLALLALWHLRADTLEQQARELALLSGALSDEIDRGLGGVEEGLRVLRDELQAGRLPASGHAADTALHTHAALMPLVDSLWLLDSGGRVRAASDDSAPPPPAAFAPALTALSADAVAVSRVFGPGGAPPRLAVAAHAPGGWIVAALPSAALLGALAQATPSPDVLMAVLRQDGARLAGTRAAPAGFDEARTAQRLATLPPMHVRHFRDGSDRLVSLHRLDRYGVQVLLTHDLRAGLAGWRETAALTALGWTLLTAVLALAVLLVQRAAQRQAQALQALQAQRGRASRLEALGSLAGGVAHDFNNVLAGLIGHAEIAQELAAPDGDLARHLGQVLQAGARGRALVERILSFGRGGAQASEVFVLTPVVEQVLGLLAASLPPGLVLERALDAPDARLRGDPTQAFEATMNLCVNAMQAMPAGGRLTVALQRLRVDAPQVLSHSRLAPGEYLALTVADQGPGITPAVMERLFEPFFTTRAAQRGTGLGLAVVHGVVAEFGGAIGVHSIPGHGARFTLYLPECRDPLPGPAPAATGDSPAAAPGQPILVLDDDPGLVDMTCQLLAGLGYEAEGCSDAQAALQALRSTPPRHAALITDEVMPGLTGTALTEALRQAGSQLPVLLVSGYGGAQLAERARRAGVSRLLAKPLRRAELELALAELLN